MNGSSVNYESTQSCPNDACPSHTGNHSFPVYLVVDGTPVTREWYIYDCPTCQKMNVFQVGAVTRDVEIPEGAIIATPYGKAEQADTLKALEDAIQRKRKNMEKRYKNN